MFSSNKIKDKMGNFEGIIKNNTPLFNKENIRRLDGTVVEHYTYMLILAYKIKINGEINHILAIDLDEYFYPPFNTDKIKFSAEELK